MSRTTIQFATYPRTEPPPDFVRPVVSVFQAHEDAIATVHREKGLTSDEVLAILHGDLVGLGFEAESGKRRDQKIERPVFYGNNGVPTVRYQTDAYHHDWRCGLEIEAGRAWMGNAVYRDLVQALVMVQVDHLVLAVPNGYRYKTGGRDVVSADFSNTAHLADALYGHSRFRLPYGLVLIGY